MTGQDMLRKNRKRTRVLPNLLTFGAGLMAFSTCTLVPSQLPPTLADAELTTQFVTVPSNQAWVRAPGAVVVMERGLLNSMEQRIGLVNHTAAPGDNMLVLRARVVEGQQQGRFRFDEFLRRVDGLPAPFGALKPGDLFTDADELGVFFWAENRSGSSTVCVLGLRRLDSTMRQLPGNTNVMDVMLRNCVNGDVEQAIEPIMAVNIGNLASGGKTASSGGIRMLSPLAGPTP